MADDRAPLDHTTAPSALPILTASSVDRLVIAYAPSDRDVGATRIIASGSLAIGRGPPQEPALLLYDGEASRLHAELVRDGASLRLIDRESRNGTYVDGKRIDAIEVAPGAVMRIGAHVMVLTRNGADALAPRTRPDSPIVGRSAAILLLERAIAEAARLTTPALVLGESGTGKELVAAEIHRLSGRSGALVAVNCAALPESLAESELFGHARGAFTGATAASEGLFGAAQGGTIFLDEIGDMPLPLQAKLLRALESGEIRGVGETRSRPASARVVAATHVDLPHAVEQGRFRGDLYARLMGTTLIAPALRDRKDDVLLLLTALIARARGDGQRPSIANALSADAAEALLCHRWPFNVRELAQLAHRLASKRERIELADLPEALRAPIESRALAAAPVLPPIDLTVRPGGAPTAEELRKVVAAYQGNVSRIAAFFGKERRQIYRWAERFGIDLEQHR